MPLTALPTGAQLDVLDTAPGGATDRVLVLLHGLLGTAETEFPALIDWLRPNFRVIAPTLRGFGRSLPKPRDFPHDFYQRDADDVLALMDALGIRRAALMGYSDGGEAALMAAVTAPERFERVITWGAVGYFGPEMRPAAQRLFPGDWISTEKLALHGIERADTFILGWIKAVHRIIDSGGALASARADRLTVPLLMLLGDQDTLNPAAYARPLLDAAPDARLVMLPCGHAVHNDARAAFRREVGAFLGLPTEDAR